MTLHAKEDAAFSPAADGTGLDNLATLIRDTARMTIGAKAVALVIEAEGAQDLGSLALTTEGALGQATYEFCIGSDRVMCRAPNSDTTRRSFRQTQVQAISTGTMMLSVPLARLGETGAGAIAFAFDQTGWQADQTIAACTNFALIAEALWLSHFAMAGLNLEVDSLTDRAARLLRIAEIDALTQLENSASFEDKARAMLASGAENAAFIMLDIDRFKLVNDLYGHQFGDAYLKTVAKAISAAFPKGSIVGRLGGDEFAVLTPLPPGGRAYLDGLLSRCRSGIQRATVLLGKPDVGHVSIGACQYPDHGRRYSTLYNNADAALYAAKDLGRSISTIFNPLQHDRYNDTEVGKQFLAAVQRDDITPYFQPIVDLYSGRCAGFEVLARWRDSSGRNLSPAEFSMIFRDHTLAEKMTRTIMHRAFGDYARHVTTKDRLRLALNVSFFDLMNPEFVFEVQTAVTENKFDWSLLTIEVTEQTMLGEQTGQIFRSLNELRARGAKVALDDFGTGYGGLRHLAHWPVDILKVDKFFIDGLASGSRDIAVLEALICMCQKLDYEVVAEGIETTEQIAALRDMGCQFGQGFVFDRPLAGEDLIERRNVYGIG